MNYLIYGLESFFIDKEIKKIIEKEKVDELAISRYDLENDLIDNILEDAETISLFDDKKIIIVDNAYIFTRKPVKNTLEQNLDLLINYLNNSNPNTIIIFNIEYEKIDSVKKITKLIKAKGFVKEFNKNNNLNSVVKDLFEDYKIDNSSINFLIDRVGNNLLILEQEITKLKNYKLEDKIINKSDIETLVHKNIVLDIFKLIDFIVNKNKEKAMEIYYEMIKMNEEPIKIIVILSNQFRLMLQAKELYKKGYTGDNIATKLGIHPYRIKLALTNSNKYSTDILIDYLDKLATLDIEIKQGKVDKYFGLEMFMLQI